jgi:hypothetical protein
MIETTQTKPKASETLKAAKALIEKHGWVQCRLGDPESGYCMLGALSKVLPPGEGFEAVRRLIYKANKIELISDWNDAPARTLPEIYAALDAATALALEAEGEA